VVNERADAPLTTVTSSSMNVAGQTSTSVDRCFDDIASAKRGVRGRVRYLSHGKLRRRPREDPLFIAPHGGPVTDEHFRNRVWYPAITAAGVRRFPPRIMRHTTASWLVQDTVPL